MGMVHVSAEELSALLDGELSPQAELRARQHLALCPSCSAEYALSVRLDDELRQPPVLAATRSCWSFRLRWIARRVRASRPQRSTTSPVARTAVRAWR